jgi:hypothetical protein
MKDKKRRLMISGDFHKKSLGVHLQLALVWAALTTVTCFMVTAGAAATPQVVQAGAAFLVDLASLAALAMAILLAWAARLALRALMRLA